MLHMNIEIKDHLIDLKNTHNNLKELVEQNLNNPYFLDISDRLKGLNIDKTKLIDEFGTFMYRILYPISYKTVSENRGENNYIRSYPVSHIVRNTEAVGKWFGHIVNKNISYHQLPRTFQGLTEKHILLTPPKKRKIVQDFYNFKLEILNIEKEDIKDYEVNIDTKFYRINMINVSPNNDKYVEIVEEVPINIFNVRIGQDLNKDFSILIELIPKQHDALHHYKERYRIQSKEISSNTLKIITQGDNYNMLCLESPQTFLNDDIKNGISNVINSAKTLGSRWEALKMKYAHLLLHKGNI